MSFKVGDWVTSKSWADPDRSPAQITNIEFATTPDEEHFVFLGEDCCVEMKYIEKWYPKEGDLCWFYKKNSKNPVFAKFVRLIDSNLGKYEACAFTPNGTNREDKLEFGYFYECRPFIGELPNIYNIQGE